MKVLAPIALCLWASTAVAQSDTLILVIDASSSIDPMEMQIQMQGYSYALRRADYLEESFIEVILFSDEAAVVSSGTYEEAIEYFDDYVIPSEIYRTGARANSITCLDKPFELIYERFTTYPGFVTIDLSGDGAHNCGLNENVSRWAFALHDNGVFINGLVIDTDIAPNATTSETTYSFYRENIVNGFIMIADGFEDFGRAISQKINLEMAHLMENENVSVD
jgi:hypothetical protein